MINGRPVVVEEKRSTSRGELDFDVNIFCCHCGQIVYTNTINKHSNRDKIVISESYEQCERK